MATRSRARTGSSTRPATRPWPASRSAAASTIRRVPDRDPAFLRYIESLGLLPGAVVELHAREPFSGPLTVRVAEADRVIGHELASQLRVEPVS